MFMNDRGIALIMVILITAFLSALGIGLIMAVFMDRLATGNMEASIAMLYAADAGIEMAAHDLAQVEDWDQVLTGAQRSGFADGAPAGIRGIPGGGGVDLTAATNQLNCGKPGACTAAQMNTISRERPWGANNPRWMLFAYGPMDRVTQLTRPAPCYLMVWIADDGVEQDGDPAHDALQDAAGHGIVRVHAEAYGVAGSRRAIEAELARVCPGGHSDGCLPGIRVQSWKDLRQALP
jgi:hypothetical protein